MTASRLASAKSGTCCRVDDRITYLKAAIHAGAMQQFSLQLWGAQVAQFTLVRAGGLSRSDNMDPAHLRGADAVEELLFGEVGGARRLWAA